MGVFKLNIEVLANFDILEHACQFVNVLCRHSYVPQPLHHVLLHFTVRRRLQDQASGEVCLVVAHEHILVLDILEYK